MTQVVDGFLRDAVNGYMSNLKAADDEPLKMSYEHGNRHKKPKIPVIGEMTTTPLGIGEVREIRYWKDIEGRISDEDEKEKMKRNIEFSLNDVNQYFEYTVIFEEGDSATFEWCDYEGNVGGGN